MPGLYLDYSATTPAVNLQQFMSKHDIYISTGTACAAHSDMSASILTLTGDEERAKSSVRVSLSFMTELSDVYRFIDALEEYRNMK